MTKIVTLRFKPLYGIHKCLAWEVKYRLHFLNIPFHSRDIPVFKICKLAKWWCHTLNQIFIKYIKARYLNQFVSEMIDSRQQDFTRCALQYEIINFVTMATYWVPDLPNVKDFSGFFWRSILIFIRSSRDINVFKEDYLSWCNFSGLKCTNILKTTGRTGKESVAMETKFNYICKCVTFGTMSISSFNGFWRKLIETALCEAKWSVFYLHYLRIRGTSEYKFQMNVCWWFVYIFIARLLASYGKLLCY